MTDETSRRQTCTDHCVACGFHFHSLGAFDAHRQDGKCCDPATAVVQSGKRVGEPSLQAWTREGWCDKMVGCWQDGKRVRWEHPVTIWQGRATDQQRAFFESVTSTARNLPPRAPSPVVGVDG